MSHGLRAECHSAFLSRASYHEESILNEPTSHLITHPLIDGISQRTRSFILVALCTVLGALAQVLMKKGADGISAGFTATIVGIFTNPYLFSGYALYGISTVLLVLALRHGQLSLIYPVIALTYVWVSILSVQIFHEQMTPIRIIGIATVVLGVGVMGRVKS